MPGNEFYRLDIVINTTGDEQAKGKLQALDKFIEHTRKRGEMLNRMQVSPAVRLVDRISAPLRTVERNLNRLNTVKKVTIEAVDKVTSVVKRITGVLTSPLTMLGAGAGMAGLIGYPLKLAGEFEQARMSLDFYTGSVEKGQKAFEDLISFAAKTPFEFPFLQEMSIMLMGAGYSFDQAKRALTAFGDAAGRTGAGMEGIQNALLGFTQIASSGTLNLQDLRQVALNLRIPINMFAKELGVAESEIGEIGKKGISAQKAMEAIVRTLEKRFGGGLKQLSESLFGLVSTIKDTARLTVYSFGAGMAGPVKRILLDLVGTTDYTSERFKAVQKKLEDAGKRVGEYFERTYKRIKDLWGEISKDPAFQKMDFGDKLLYVLNRSLDAVSNWLSGPGGKKVQKIFVKLGEIAAKAWLVGLAGMAEGAVSSLAKGNILGGVGLLAGAGMLGGGLLLRGVWGLGKGVYGAGKWLVDKLGYGAATTAEAATGAAETAATTAALAKPAGMLARLSSIGRILGRFALPAAIGLELFSIFRTPPEQRAARAAEAFGRWGGMFAGAKLGAIGGAALGSVIPGAGTAIGAGIGSFLGGIAGILGGEAIMQRLFGLLDKVNFNALKEKAITWIKELPGEIAGHLGYIAGYAVEKLSQLPGLFSEWFRQARESAIQWVTGLPEQIAGFVESIPDRVGAAIENVKSTFASLGKAIPDAIVGGFNWAKERLSAAGKWVIEKAIAGVEAAKSLGKRMAEGFEAGRQAARTAAYALGGIITRPHLGIVAEAGPEAIIPLSSRFRSRALDLWQRTGEYLGVRPYAVGGFAGPVPVGAGAGDINVTVSGITVNVAGSDLDEDALAWNIGQRIVAEIKKALANRI